MLYCINVCTIVQVINHCYTYLFIVCICRSLPETEKLTTQLHVLAVERDKLMELIACMQDR